MTAIRRPMILVSALLIALAAPALATVTDPEQPPAPAPEPAPERPVTRAEDGESLRGPDHRTGDMPCCRLPDGRVVFHAPLGIGEKRTRAFCTAASVEAPQSIPACVIWGAKE